MGRGLSPLQRQILEVGRNKREGHRREAVIEHPGRGADFYAGMIYKEIFGWEPIRDYVQKGGCNFLREEIGHNEYNVAHAAVSRSLRRLQDRGLILKVDPEYGGYDLTLLGQQTLGATMDADQ